MSDDRPVVYEELGKIIYRASGIGTCSNLLARTRLGEFGAPTPDWLQKAFDQGNKHEDQIIKLAEVLINDEIEGRQHEVNIRLFGNVWVRGHVDGLSKKLSAVVDAKALSADNWAKCQTDIAKHFPYYVTQMSLYKMGLGLDRALLAVGIKSADGEKIQRVEMLDITAELVDIQTIKMKLMKVEVAFASGKLPYEECDYKAYPCPFYYDCQPRADVTVDDALDELCESYNDVAAQIDKLTGQKALLRDEIMRIVGEPGKKATKSWKATWFEQRQVSFDKKRLAEELDIDLTQYEKVSMGARLKVTPTTQDELEHAE